MCSWTNSRRELDRALLEVLPEREVAEHLEEREVVTVEARPRRCRRCGRPFCDSVVSGAGGVSLTEEERHLRLHSRTDRGASSRHRHGARASTTGSGDGPRSSKNERKPSRSSAVVRIPGFYERCRRRPDAATPPEAGSPAPPVRRCEAPRRARSRAGQPRPWRHGPPRPHRVATGTRTRRATGRKRSR